MSSNKQKNTARDFAYIAVIAMLMAAAATLGYNWPEYDKYDLQDAEQEYLCAESDHRSAYFNVLLDARHAGYQNPEYKRLQQAKFDVKMPQYGSMETRIAQKRKKVNELGARADSVKNKVIQDYIESDSAYIATKQKMQQASEHLNFIRAEVRRADSLEQLPVHKLMQHNIKQMFSKTR